MKKSDKLTTWDVISFLLMIVFFLGVIIGAVKINKIGNKAIGYLLEHGDTTVCKFKEWLPSKASRIAIYYFYCRGEKIYTSNSIRGEEKWLNSENKYYMVIYLRSKPKNTTFHLGSKIYLSCEVPIDSIQYYFPQGQNPFAGEIDSIKKGLQPY